MSKQISAEQAFQAAVEESLNSADCTIDSIRCRKNGNVEVKRGYFYTFGMTAEKYAGAIRECLERDGIPAQVSGEDHWAAWPKESYFLATIVPVMEPKSGN